MGRGHVKNDGRHVTLAYRVRIKAAGGQPVPVLEGGRGRRQSKNRARGTQRLTRQLAAACVSRLMRGGKGVATQDAILWWRHRAAARCAVLRSHSAQAASAEAVGHTLV